MTVNLQSLADLAADPTHPLHREGVLAGRIMDALDFADIPADLECIKALALVGMALCHKLLPGQPVAVPQWLKNGTQT